MRIIKKIKLIWTFYKNFLFLSMLVTLICVGLSWEYGYGIFNTLFWLKTGTLLLIYFFINSYKSREYYYFQNLGISRTLLWASAMLFDFALYLLLIIQTNRLR